MADVWTDRLSEYLDGEMDVAEAARVEAHLAVCPECCETLRQLRAVKVRARALEDRAPEVDLWAGIAERIRGAAAERVAVTDLRARRAGRWRRVSFSVPQLLAASLVLIVATGGGAWLVLSGGGRTVATPVEEAAESSAAVALLASFDNADYDVAVVELERILAAGRDRLDPRTLKVLEQSLAVIDAAIREARAALAGDPADNYLAAHLDETMRQKVRFLTRAARVAAAGS